MSKIQTFLIYLALIALVILISLTPSCDEDLLHIPSKCPSFQDVYFHYEAQYGSADSFDSYQSSDKHIIEAWWWYRGLCVRFERDSNKPCGWRITDEYTFQPMKGDFYGNQKF